MHGSLQMSDSICHVSFFVDVTSECDEGGVPVNTVSRCGIDGVDHIATGCQGYALFGNVGGEGSHLSRVFTHDDAVNDDPDAMGRVFEGVAIEEGDVAGFPDLERPDAIVDAKNCRGPDRNGG